MRSRLPSVQRPSISIAYLQLLVEILGERGIDRARLFDGMPIDRDAVDQPQARMSELQWALLVLRALEITGDPGLGYEYGLRMRPTLHGMLGYAALSSASLGEAQDLMVRYFRSRQARFTAHRAGDAKQARLELRERGDIPVARSFFVENILLGIARATAVLLGSELLELKELEIWFDTPAPPHYAAWRKRLPAVRFGRPVNAVCVPGSWLQLRPVLADPLASRQAIELCERELALAAGAEADFVARVRAELVLVERGGYPDLETVARRLHVSGRSLKRRLQGEGASFLALLEETRQRDAQQLLAHDTLDVQSIAARLGYRNPANFSRAFQRWRGMPPSQWRKRSPRK